MQSYAQDSAQTHDANASDTVTEFEAIDVTAPREPAADVLTPDSLRMKRATSVSDIVVQELGVSAVRRGGSAPEPVIRGLGYERVQTQIGCVPLYGGCPGRMDPPATYIPKHAVQSVRVLKGLPSVTEGPAGTAGRIMTEMDYERSPDSEPEVHGHAKVFGETAKSGGGGEAGVRGGNEWFDGSLSVGYSKANDYESPSGVNVPADYEDVSVAASAGFRPLENHRWSNVLVYVDESDISYPSMAMDSPDSDFMLYQTGYRIDFEDGLLKRIRVEGGLSAVDHLMDNSDKPNITTMFGETETESDTYGAKIVGDLEFSDIFMLTAGMDFFTLNRDATRERTFFRGPNTGRTFRDRLWPDASQTDLGAFLEGNTRLSPSLNLRTGVRGDVVWNDADAVDEASLRNRTVRENYESFYGEDAGDVDQTDVLGGGNVVLEWKANEQFDFFAGTGISSRSAGVTERYLAFSPGTGGFTVGNPTLDPEVKYEVDAGVNWQGKTAKATFSCFGALVRDYIAQTQIAFQDVDGDARPDIVRGYENIDAYLYGAEAGIVVDPIEHLSIPLSAMWVQGRNKSDGGYLPEIPPLEARAALVVYGGTEIAWWSEFGGRFVAEQDHVDNEFPEDETSGFAVFHLKGGVKLSSSWEIEAGIENLFDKEYNEHLTRESAFNYGNGLDAGDEIPEPGRNFYLAVRYDF
jgi:iron complex outermembrane receptor protein